MRRLGYRWRESELGDAIRYWLVIALVYPACVFALILVAHRWPW